MCQDGGNTIKSSGFSGRQANAEGRKQARPRPHARKQQSIQWPLHSGSLNAKINYSLHSPQTSWVKICATLTNLSMENSVCDLDSVIGCTATCIARGKPTTLQPPNYSYFVLFSPHFNMIQDCWNIWIFNQGEKTGENRQMSMLLMVISSKRPRWALNTKSVNCCSLTLQFSKNLWSRRIDFSLSFLCAPFWSQSANQNQRCNSLALCADNMH